MRTYKRDARGRFAKTGSSRRKASRPKGVTRSRSGGTTYETKKTRGLFGGVTVETKAYRGAEYRGSVVGYHNKKKGTATIDFLYVAKDHRGTGVSKAMVSRQVYHARRSGLSVVAAAERSDGGQKFVERNMTAGVKIPARASGSSSEITALMEGIGRSQAKRHEKSYRKRRR